MAFRSLRIFNRHTCTMAVVHTTCVTQMYELVEGNFSTNVNNLGIRIFRVILTVIVFLYLLFSNKFYNLATILEFSYFNFVLVLKNQTNFECLRKMFNIKSHAIGLATKWLRILSLGGNDFYVCGCRNVLKVESRDINQIIT